MGGRARRVVLKSRFVVLGRAGQKSVATHLRYIERDGTTRDGERGGAYGPDTDVVDLKVFEERGRRDRHQFRMILSAEDATQLQDLKQFTREFMARVATDLETRLDWVAVDHWDTDNPHTHIVLRGRAADGRDLVIAPTYMAHGMRLRGCDILTEWLGPRTELEVQESLRREVAQARFTSLDRTLLTNAHDQVIDLTGPIAARRDSLQLQGRLQRLEQMGLAIKLNRDQWLLVSETRSTLVALGERGDIVRAINRALKETSREISFEPRPREVIVGRIAGKGVEEFFDRPYLVIDAIDGRAHLVKLSPSADLSEFPLQGVIEARAGEKGLRSVRLLSSLSVEEQVHAPGSTWLDQQLLRGSAPPAIGFGAIAQKAIAKRADVLVARGQAVLRGATDAAPEPARDGCRPKRQMTERELGPPFRKAYPMPAAEPPKRPITGDVSLAGRRFAMLETDLGFSLIPWERAQERGVASNWFRRNGPSR